MKKTKLISEILRKELKISSKEINELTKTKNQNQFALGIYPKWDSLNHVRILTKLEKNFNFKIDAKNVEKFSSFKKIVKNIKK